MHSVGTLLLFASICLAQAQISASGQMAQQQSNIRRDIFPTLTTSSIHIPVPTLLPPAILDEHKRSFLRDDQTDCSPRSGGNGQSHATYGELARIASDATTPPLWSRVFHAQKHVIDGTGRLGETELGQYDPAACVKACNMVHGCTSMNIYFEFTPTLYLSDACPTAPGMVSIKCSLWTYGSSLVPEIDAGHMDHQFPVQFAGSNLYRRGPFPEIEAQDEQPDEGSSEESSANGRASTRLAGFTVASVMALWVL